MFVSIFFISCSSDPVKIVIDKKDLTTGKITIDGKQSYTFKDSVIHLQLLPGKHSFVLNNNAAKDFEVGEKGGLLNLDDQEYVAYEIEYNEQNNGSGINFNSMKINAVLLIDSFIIIPKSAFGMHSDSSLKKILPKLQAAKNGNYFFPMGGSGNEYDTNEQVHGLKKFGKGKLFINSFWDYSLGENIPETVSITTTKGNTFGNASTSKIALLHAPLFLFAAQLSPEQYIVKSIAEIEAGTEDKEKEKVKEESQMKF